jgi:hypothetical protein
MTKDEALIKKVIETYVNRNGFTEVRASIDGFDDTSTFNAQDGEDRIVPDIMAYRRGGQWYIEIVSKEDDQAKVISKWKLLSVLGKSKGGGLILISPSGTYALAERLTKRNDIEAKIVKFNPAD